MLVGLGDCGGTAIPWLLWAVVRPLGGAVAMPSPTGATASSQGRCQSAGQQQTAGSAPGPGDPGMASCIPGQTLAPEESAGLLEEARAQIVPGTHAEFLELQQKAHIIKLTILTMFFAGDLRNRKTNTHTASIRCLTTPVLLLLAGLLSPGPLPQEPSNLSLPAGSALSGAAVGTRTQALQCGLWVPSPLSHVLTNGLCIATLCSCYRPPSPELSI